MVAAAGPDGVLDPEGETARAYQADQPPRVPRGDDDLTLPDVLGEFRVAVGRFFA